MFCIYRYRGVPAPEIIYVGTEKERDEAIADGCSIDATGADFSSLPSHDPNWKKPKAKKPTKSTKSKT